MGETDKEQNNHKQSDAEKKDFSHFESMGKYFESGVKKNYERG